MTDPSPSPPGVAAQAADGGERKAIVAAGYVTPLLGSRPEGQGRIWAFTAGGGQGSSQRSSKHGR